MYSSAYVWAKVLGHMESRLTPQVVSTWFDDTEILELTDEKLVLYSPSSFRKDIILRRCVGYIKEAMQEIFQMDVTVTVLDETEIEAYRGRQQKPEFIEFNPQFTFDNFVVGSSNQLAQAAAYAVAQHPAELYNPLFLFGPSGLGKTHLLFAIMNEVRKLHPNFNILYVTSEEFTNELIDALALRQNRNLAFKEKYRNVDMLLVDDVHFIAGKYSVQEEFFHTFNALYNEKKQIILTSDRPPRDISYLESRLQTRFESGLMADIQPPDTELRAAIFKMKTQLLGIRLDNEVLTYLSENITNNVRQIEGALKRLRAQSFITGEPISKAMAADVLKDFFTTDGAERVTIEKVFSFVSRRYGFSTEDIRGKKRTSDIVYVRHIAMYLCTEYTGLSLKAIGRQFGRDHSTVINARDNVINRMKKDSAFDKEIRELSKELTTL